MTKSIMLAGVAAFAMTGGAAFAQTAPAGATDDGAPEIVVTAQKREERLQDVPAAVTVVSGDQLDAQGIGSVESLLQLVPTLNFRESATGLDSSLFLRGVGTINFSIAAEPSVAFVLDGVIQARAGEAFGDLYDIERIEVLRGPQGTLFGKNASAGVVNVVSRRPSSSFGGYIDVSAFEDQEYKVRASVTGPLGENVRARVTGVYANFDGYIFNRTLNRDVNGYKRWGVRGVVEADVTERLMLTFIGDYRESDDDCCVEIIGTVPAGTAAAPFTGIPLIGDGTRTIIDNFLNTTKERSWGASLQADLDVGSLGTLTSITAYRDWRNTGTRDGDYVDRPYVGIAQLHDFGPQPSTTFTQELRLTSPGNQPLEYVLGLYYYDADATRTFQRDVIVCSASTLPGIPGGAIPCAPGASTLQTLSSRATFGSSMSSYAAFGNLTWRLGDTFRLIGGARYTHDKVRAFHDRIPAAAAGPGLRTDGSGYRLSTSNDNFSWRLGAQFDAARDFMLYATFAKGYKGPAFNVFFNQNPQQLNVIEPETGDSYEAGFKLTALDRRLIVNTSVFYAKYQNFQANNFDTLNGVVITRLTNAGTVSTKGFEMDVLARPSRNFTLTAGVAYTDAQIDRFNIPPGSPAGTPDRRGEQLPLAPEWRVTLGADWKIELPTSFDLSLGSNVSLTSDQVSDLQAAPLVRQQLTIDGYAIVNANVGLVDKDDRWRVSFLVKNLFDKSYASLITPGGPGGSLRYLVPRDADRYFGVNARFNFGSAR
jgi:iron complex outermembrane recepter protein